MEKARLGRYALWIGALIANAALVTAVASASVDMTVGTREVVQNHPLSDCSTRAKSALSSVLQNAAEAGTGTGQWLAYGPADASGGSTSAAAIHCYPLERGYVVTFTCAVQTPPNGETASALCTKLTGAFGTP